MTVPEALGRATMELAEAGVDTPDVDAALLLGRVLGLSRTAVHARREPLSDAERQRFGELVARRARREPLAYVLGEWGFRRLTLEVDARALVPRPETEILVERCLVLLTGIAEPRVLDLGAGSGAVAFAIADEHRGARVVAVDSSPAALDLARENLARLDGAVARVELVQADLGSPPGTGYDLVVSNPPYVLPAEIDALEPEVRDWEPRAALVSPDATERVAEAALRALRSGGWLVVEAAADRAREVERALGRRGYVDTGISHDLAGRERVVEGRKP